MNFNIIVALLMMVVACSRKPAVIEPEEKALEEKWSQSISNAREQNEKEDKALKEAMKNLEVQFEESPYGGYYAITKTNAQGDSIRFGTLVDFIYQVRSINGEILYSFVHNGTQELMIDKQEMLSGINDLLKHFKDGEEGILLLPSNKAYGKLGDFEKINTDTPVWIDIKVLKVNNE